MNLEEEKHQDIGRHITALESSWLRLGKVAEGSNVGTDNLRVRVLELELLRIDWGKN